MPPLFSVVIPTYNRAGFLKTALQSVLDQTYQDFEIIVVNNHSEDDTLGVIRDAKDSRIKTIDFRNHGVIGASRNVGIKASDGKYIAFLDSDDAWYPNKLEKVAQAITANAAVGLVSHDQEIYRDGQKTNVQRTGPKPGNTDSIYDYLLLTSNCISTSSAVVARRFLNEVELFSEDPGLVTLEDYDLWLKLSRVCNFHFIHESLGLYNYHSDAASAKVELHLNNLLTVIKKHADISPSGDRPGFNRAIRRRYAGGFYGAARQYHRSNKAKHAQGHYARTIRTDPFYIRTYAALTLLLIDSVFGQSRRKNLLRTVRPGSWLASWLLRYS